MYKTPAIKYNNIDVVVIRVFVGSKLKFKDFTSTCSFMYTDF